MPDEALLWQIRDARAHLARVVDRLRFGPLAIGGEQDACQSMIVEAQVASLQAALRDVDLAIKSSQNEGA